MNQNKNLLSVLRAATAASALALALGAALAQGPVQGVPGTPRVEQPNQRQDNPNGGGGVGIGINIDLGSIFNAIRNATRKDQPDKDDPKKPPVLQKSAVTVSSGSSGNYTIDWVVQYANNTGATLPNVLVKDGPIATIIPGSLLPPPTGWTAQTNALPLPADNFALWTGTNIAPHGVMTATFPPPLPASMSLAGSGDGYQPIPYTRLSVPAGQRIYFMNHHATPGTKLFKCLDLTTGVACTGWGLGKTLPAGDSSGNNSGTMANDSEYTIDNGKMYYASQGPSGIGIGCYNLETDTECGLANFGAQTLGLLINGPWRVGNELYVADTDGALYCANLGGLVPCVGSNYKIPATTIKIHVTKPGFNNYSGGYLAGKVIANKVYITSIQSFIKYTNCFDSTTKAACWNTSAPTIGTAPYSFSSGSDSTNVSNYLYYDVGGAAVAVCTMRRTPAAQLCVDALTGAAQTGLPTVLPGLNLGAGLETYIAGKTYFVKSLYQGEPRENAYCWNWSTQAACTTAPLGIIANSPGGTHNYGSNSDAQGCIWIYGDGGKLWHFNSNNIDSTTGLAKPCGGGAQFIKIFQPLQYCSGPKPFRWTSVEVKGAPLANYSKFIVKVLDSINNTVLFTKDLKATGQLQANITGIDVQTISRPLKIEIEYTPNPGMGASDEPYLEVRYNAPPIEFCFKSTHTCEQSKITNIVETPDPAIPGKYISVKVDVDKPQNCTIKPPPPVCGQPGQPPCPTCGTVTTPACTACGQPGQPNCPDPVCIPGTPGCPVIGVGCVPGDPRCNPVRPPPPKPVCLTGDCPDKPAQSIAEEFKEPKVACARKTKPVENAPKKVVVKPKPKPALVAAPTVPADPSAAPKPKPKPRPKPAVKPAARDDDDC